MRRFPGPAQKCAMKHKAKPRTIITIQENIVSPWVPTCPACGEPITAQAAVEEFKPDDWVSFWGRMGERWKKCEGAHGGRKFVHFYVQFNRGVSHRLAWIAPEPDAAPVQETLL